MPWKDGVWHNAKKQQKTTGIQSNKYETAFMKMADANNAMLMLMTGKAKGKGSAKGKGNGKGNTAALKEGHALKEGQWLCLNHVCKFAVQRIPNPAGARRCTNNECCLPKSEAMNPKLDERVRPVQPSTSAKTAQVQAAAEAARQKSKATAEATKSKTEETETGKDAPKAGKGSGKAGAKGKQSTAARAGWSAPTPSPTT